MTRPAVQPLASAETYQQAQSLLSDGIEPLVAAAVSLIRQDDLPGTLPRFRQAMRAVASKFGSASAALALQRFQAARLAATGSLLTQPVPPAPVDVQALDSSLGWATRLLWDASPQPLPDLVATVTGVVEKAAQDAGRATMVNASRADTLTKGWYRVAEPNACYFCALLALRGPVYGEQTSRFKAHDHCRCHAEPWFGGKWRPGADVARWQKLYEAGPRNLKAFRRRFENRGDGATGKPVKAEPLTLTTEQARRTLSQLEASLPAARRAGNAKYIDFLQRRIADVQAQLAA